MAADGVPPSPTAYRLEEERRRLRHLQQVSLEKLADVRALALQKAQLQEAAHAFLFPARAASSAAPQSRLHRQSRRRAGQQCPGIIPVLY
jgi:hypothetical protein